MGKKASKDEVLRRTRTVVQWLMEGHRSKDIIPNMMSLWEIKTVRTAENYISRAYGFMLDNITKDVQKELAFHESVRLERCRELIKKQKELWSVNSGLAIGDKHRLHLSYEKAIQDIFKDIGKLKGLYVLRIGNADGSNIQTPKELIFKVD